MSALEPGLYRATVRGRHDVTVFVDGAGYGRTAAYVGKEWRVHAPDLVADARPLIVLDLAGSGSLLVSSLRKDGYSDLAFQIEAQVKPARIEEPGWDGKVLAHTENCSIRREFVRHGKRESARRFNWSDGAGFGSLNWEDLIDPVLIRDGIAS